MRGTIDIHPEGQEFKAKVSIHVVGVPFSTISLEIGECKLTLYAKPEDAVKLTRVSQLLNEVFAKEGEQVE